MLAMCSFDPEWLWPLAVFGRFSPTAEHAGFQPLQRKSEMIGNRAESSRKPERGEALGRCRSR
jgi:hypothetical protein